MIVTFSSPEPTAPQTDSSPHDASLPATTESPSHTATAETAPKSQALTDGVSSHEAAPSDHAAAATEERATSHDTAHAPAATEAHETGTTPSTHTATPKTTTSHALPATAMMSPTIKPPPRGVAFVEAAIAPLDYELNDRWWGWRPNDIINVTDNVNNFQLGVLEVTRRTAVALAERISRTGTTDAYDENLEQAMNWFMVKATSYWFPSAESKYEDGLDEFRVYLEKLKAGKASFYTRTDNLIPLLSTFEDLLGSCDENLVKQVNDDGSPVSFFVIDDYFYYTQGVAKSMATVLEAVHHDFLLTLESRNSTDLLHHAILACQRASEIDPWIILDRDLSSILANHRANMAAPISHARFYLGQLIKALST
ncbi:DUF2333 family protein [Desulfosarcina cetonica]|uniref:DUF2333 family protein n=1 Tax=Desulfosarcina cetonica TaxID=90730 RepID=UPI0006D05F2B|nr:DUF2333 family protein [Desulfosarcina cetonica]